jgi:hypothetical protein
MLSWYSSPSLFLLVVVLLMFFELGIFFEEVGWDWDWNDVDGSSAMVGVGRMDDMLERSNLQ